MQEGKLPHTLFRTNDLLLPLKYRYRCSGFADGRKVNVDVKVISTDAGHAELAKVKQHTIFFRTLNDLSSGSLPRIYAEHVHPLRQEIHDRLTSRSSYRNTFPSFFMQVLFVVYLVQDCRLFKVVNPGYSKFIGLDAYDQRRQRECLARTASGGFSDFLGTLVDAGRASAILDGQGSRHSESLVCRYSTERDAESCNESWILIVDAQDAQDLHRRANGSRWEGCKVSPSRRAAKFPPVGLLCVRDPWEAVAAEEDTNKNVVKSIPFEVLEQSLSHRDRQQSQMQRPQPSVRFPVAPQPAGPTSDFQSQSQQSQWEQWNQAQVYTHPLGQMPHPLGQMPHPMGQMPHPMDLMAMGPMARHQIMNLMTQARATYPMNHGMMQAAQAESDDSDSGSSVSSPDLSRPTVCPTVCPTVWVRVDQTELWQALKEGANEGANEGAKPDWEAASQLLHAFDRSGIDVRQVLTGADERSGLTPLMAASQEGNVDMVRGLLELADKHGARVGFDREHTTASLMMAASRGRGADRSRPVGGDETLAMHPEVVQTLLMRTDADVDASNQHGWTALSLAALHDDADVAQALIEAGASLRSPANDLPNPAATPLVNPVMVAAKNNSAEVLEELMAAGADREGGRMLRRMASGRHFGVVFAIGGRTALMEAAARGHARIAEILLEDRNPASDPASVDARDQSTGMTALMMAAAEGHLEVVEILLRHKADPWATDREGSRGKSAITYAQNRGHGEVVLCLQSYARASPPVSIRTRRKRS